MRFAARLQNCRASPPVANFAAKERFDAVAQLPNTGQTFTQRREDLRYTFVIMEFFSVLGNRQLLDGGAMFGNCPRQVWTRWCPPDEQNRIDLACRALLIREPGVAGRHPNGRHVLVEAGIGVFFEPKLRERYGVVESDHRLLANLADLGVAPEDIDIVVLSHLHFDHVGGILAAYEANAPLRLAFPNATFVVGHEAWARAQAPHPRDRASFIPGLCELLKQSGRLEIVRTDRCALLGPSYSFTYSQGHTPGLMLTRVACQHGAMTFMGDLIPGSAWVHLPITMGYDRFPELLIDEKKEMLDRVIEGNEWIFFTHDPKIAAAKIERDAGGRYITVQDVERVCWTAG
jgi:glyoxylase-like metal-dependent hydrolase (beta-lactamase superfamily II)